MEIDYARVVVLIMSIVGFILLLGATAGNYWVVVIDDRNDDIEAGTYGLWKVCVWQLYSRKTMSCHSWNNKNDPNVLNFRKDNIAWLDIPAALAVISCLLTFVSMVMISGSLVLKNMRRKLLDAFVVLFFVVSAGFMIGAASHFTVQYEGMFPLYTERLSWAYLGAWFGTAVVLICAFIELFRFVRIHVKASQIV